MACHLLFADNLRNSLLRIRYVLVLLHELRLADDSVFVLNLFLLLVWHMVVSFVVRELALTLTLLEFQFIRNVLVQIVVAFGWLRPILQV